MSRTPHEIVNPLILAQPVGFSHALVAGPGRIVHIGGQHARRSDGKIVGDGVVEQFDKALGNMVEALRAADARPVHVVDMRVFTTAMKAYRAGSAAIGTVYRRYMGRFYPPMSVLGVTELWAPDALIEVACTAVVPETPQFEPMRAEQERDPLDRAEEALFGEPLDPGDFDQSPESDRL